MEGSEQWEQDMASVCWAWASLFPAHLPAHTHNGMTISLKWLSMFNHYLTAFMLFCLALPTLHHSLLPGTATTTAFLPSWAGVPLGGHACLPGLACPFPPLALPATHPCLACPALALLGRWTGTGWGVVGRSLPVLPPATTCWGGWAWADLDLLPNIYISSLSGQDALGTGRGRQAPFSFSPQIHFLQQLSSHPS